MSSSKTEDEADDEASAVVTKSVTLETIGKGRDLIINLNIILYFISVQIWVQLWRFISWEWLLSHEIQNQ